MNRYYVDKNPSLMGDHEVHREGCLYLPLKEDRVDLGRWPSCTEAVNLAKQTYPEANGCFLCAKQCRTTNMYN
jgi:hypothetical protein